MEVTASKLIFITGASRSGTTLLSFILRRQSDIFGLKELQYFGEVWDPRDRARTLTADESVAAVAKMFARQSQGVLAAKTTQRDEDSACEFVEGLGEFASDPASLFAATVAELCGPSGKTIPCEQTPRNIYYATALLDVYPNAHVIHMMRDPRAVMASQKQRWMRRRLATDKSAFPRIHTLRAKVNYHPYTISKLWNRASQEAARLDGHPRFTLLKFEDLVLDPEAELQALCKSIDVEFEAGMLDIAQVNSSHQSSVGGSRHGFNKDTIDAWNQKLSAAETAVTERHCEAMMRQFGYAPSQAGAASSDGIGMNVSYLLHLAGVLLLNPRRAWIQYRGVSAGHQPGHGKGRHN